jgi:predicted transposase YdaD
MMAQRGRVLDTKTQNAIERAVHQYQRSQRQTARDLDVARETVRKYCRKHNAEAQPKTSEPPSEPQP